MLPGPAVLRNGEETLEDEHCLSENTIGVRVRRARQPENVTARARSPIVLPPPFLSSREIVLEAVTYTPCDNNLAQVKGNVSDRGLGIF